MNLRDLTLVGLLLALAGCQAFPTAIAEASLTVVPRATGAYHLASAIAPFTAQDVASVALTLRRAGEQTVLATLDVPAAQLGQPITFSHLTGDTTYVVEAEATDADGRVISNASASRLEIRVDREAIVSPAPLVVQLRDRSPRLKAIGEPTVLASGIGSRFSPAVAFAAELNTGMVVWREAAVGFAGRRVSADATAIDDPLVLDVNTTADPTDVDDRAPALLYDPKNHQFGLATFTQATNAVKPYLTTFPTTGATGTAMPIGTPLAGVSGARVDSGVSPAVAHADYTNRYVWAEPVATGGFSVTRFTPGGTSSSFTMPVGTGAQVSGLAVAAAPGDWVSLVVAATQDGVRSLRLDGDKAPGALVALSEGTAAVSHPAVAYNARGGEYFVVWYQAGTGHMARRVRMDGTPNGAAFALDAVAEDTGVSLAFSPAADEFALVYAQGGQIQWQRLASDGTRLGTPLSLGDGSEPAVAYNGRDNTFLAAWCRRVDAQDQVVAQVFDSYLAE